MEYNHVPDLKSMDDGTVLKATREINGKTYTYVFLRADHKWYMSGRKTWVTSTELTRWFRHMKLSVPTLIAKEWEEVELHDPE